MRFLVLLAAFSFLGCAKPATPPIAPQNVEIDPRSITIRETKKGFLFAMADGRELDEDGFRNVYRAATASSNLDDELAHDVLKKQSLVALGMGTGMAAAGISALALLPPCSKNSVPSEGKCLEGKATIAVVALGGLWLVGCEAVKQTDCIKDHFVEIGWPKSAHLNRDRAQYYVDRYNDAIAGVPPEFAEQETPKPAEAPKAAHVQLGPGGLSGSF
jgi:hypothetical protein